MKQMMNDIIKRTQSDISEAADILIDNALTEIQSLREKLLADIRNENLPLETYDLDDRCKELIEKENLMYYVLNKVKFGVMREDIIEVLSEMDKPIETISFFLEKGDYAEELQKDEYDLAVMRTFDKHKEINFYNKYDFNMD